MDWKKTALVVIDMENAFIDPASPLCIKNALATIPACGKIIDKARERYNDDEVETFGNTNKNGNLLYMVVKEWVEQKR